MNKPEDSNKENSKITNMFKKAAGVGKRMASNVQKSAKALSEKNKTDSYEKRLKKYNPLFLEKYNSAEFKLPNMIVVVDDAVRRNIDVCEGAIGWLSNDSGMEVLYLYDEFAPQSNINFIPNIACDAIYYVDNFDRSRFVRVDCIFSKAHEEKLAELEHIAYSLGAKSCAIEIIEIDKEIESLKKRMQNKTNISVVSAGEDINNERYSQTSSQRSGKTLTYFEGNDSPKTPQLKWYAHDDNIKRLIEMRCSQNNSIKSKTLELEGSISATMSQKTACSIDASLKKIGNKGNVTMEKQAIKENTSKLIFEIEF